MYKKSELYNIFMTHFFREQQTEQNLTRINALGAEYKDIINIAQQAATESTIEILLNMLSDLSIIEDDIEITSEWRKNTILNTVNQG